MLYFILGQIPMNYELQIDRPISKFHDKYTFIGSSEYDLIDSTFHQSDHLQNRSWKIIFLKLFT